MPVMATIAAKRQHTTPKENGDMSCRYGRSAGTLASTRSIARLQNASNSLPVPATFLARADFRGANAKNRPPGK